MKTLSKDARGFIDGVTSYIKRDAHGKDVLPRVSALLTRVTTAAKKERVASVATPVAVSESEKSAISRMLERLLGHEVECRWMVDADLLGGIKITVADWVVDTTLASQLTGLTHTLV